MSRRIITSKNVEAERAAKAKEEKANASLVEIYQTATEFSVLNSKSKKIAIHDVRQMFIADASITLEAIQNKIKIPIAHLRIVADREDWFSLRSQVHKMTRKQTQKVITSQLKDLLQVNLQIQQLKNVQLMQQVDHIQKHLAVYGDLWLRDPDNPGQILKDANGLPKRMPIPREMTDSQEMVKLLQGVNSLIGERDSGNEQPLLSGKGKTIEPEFEDVFGPEDRDS